MAIEIAIETMGARKLNRHSDTLYLMVYIWQVVEVVHVCSSRGADSALPPHPPLPSPANGMVVGETQIVPHHCCYDVSFVELPWKGSLN